MNKLYIQWAMLIAIAKKELWQLSRDRLTAVLLLSVPLAQILIFGFAIELSPKHWPGVWVQTNTQAVATASDAQLSLAMRKKITANAWLELPAEPITEQQAQKELQSGRACFILYLPKKPSDYLLGSEPMPIKLVTDVSDPYVSAAMSMLLRSFQTPSAFSSDIATALPSQQSMQFESTISPVQLDVQAKYAIENSSGAYLVPALTGVILTLTLTLMAAFSLVRERERGTWDSLLSTPAGASVIVLGKLLPYAVLGLLLFAMLQGVAHLLFASAFASWMQWIAASFFMLGLLGLGACLSLLAKTQMQAMQLGVFFYLPSILLSGFMFPFHAMPHWARWIGELLPLTHFLRVLRADLFRQADANILMQLTWPIMSFAVVMLGVAILAYRRRIQ